MIAPRLIMGFTALVLAFLAFELGLNIFEAAF